MNHRLLNLFLIALVMAHFASVYSLKAQDLSDFPSCSDQSQLAQFCEISVEQLRPTQYSVGMKVVEEKEKKLKDLISSNEEDYHQYLKKKAIPIVVGNHGEFYILDHHHLARAVYEIGKKHVIAEIKQNFNQLQGSAFWDRMKASHFVYLYDSHGEAINPQDLPRHVKGLKDDPFRSLAGSVRDAGGYDDQEAKKVYYAEFLWAQYFRKRGISAEQIQNDFKATVKKAIDLAHLPQASHLPGYRP